MPVIVSEKVLALQNITRPGLLAAVRARANRAGAGLLVLPSVELARCYAEHPRIGEPKPARPRPGPLGATVDRIAQAKAHGCLDASGKIIPGSPCSKPKASSR